MKKIICLLALVCCSHFLFAQDSSMMKNDDMMQHDMGKMKDCVYMKDGKMMAMMNGKMMMMNKDMTMQNGTMVMKNGKVKMKDGSTKMMKDDDCVYMDGTMADMKTMDHDMMMKDSTNQ